MNRTIITPAGETPLASLDNMIRNPRIERKRIAEMLGIAPPKLYDVLSKEAGVRVATFSFLVDEMGRPLKPVTDEEIQSAGKALLDGARRRRKTVVLAM